MSTYCQELNHKITYGDPFFILIQEGKEKEQFFYCKIASNLSIAAKPFFAKGVNYYVTRLGTITKLRDIIFKYYNVDLSEICQTTK